MLYPYNPKNSDQITVTLQDGRTLSGEYFDGQRIDLKTIPKGKIWYQTRHGDDDMSIPVTIRQEGCIIVNFCGTIISETDLGLTTEIELADVNFA